MPSSKKIKAGSQKSALSDGNGKMDPARLAVWTSIGVNMSTYEPTSDQILKRYLLKFSKGGKADSLHSDDLGLLDPEGVVDAMQDGGYFARYGEPAQQPRGEHAGTHLPMHTMQSPD